MSAKNKPTDEVLDEYLFGEPTKVDTGTTGKTTITKTNTNGVKDPVLETDSSGGNKGKDKPKNPTAGVAEITINAGDATGAGGNKNKPDTAKPGPVTVAPAPTAPPPPTPPVNTTPPPGPVVVPETPLTEPYTPPKNPFDPALYSQLPGPQGGKINKPGEENNWFTDGVFPALVAGGLLAVSTALPQDIQDELARQGVGVEYRTDGQDHAVDVTTNNGPINVHNTNGIDIVQNAGTAVSLGSSAIQWLVDYQNTLNNNATAQAGYQAELDAHNQQVNAANQATQSQLDALADTYAGQDPTGLGGYGGGTNQAASGANTTNWQTQAGQIVQAGENAIKALGTPTAPELQEANGMSPALSLLFGAGALATTAMGAQPQATVPQDTGANSVVTQSAQSDAAGMINSVKDALRGDDLINQTYAGDGELYTNSAQAAPSQGGINPLVQYYGMDSLDSNPWDTTNDKGGSGRSDEALDNQAPGSPVYVDSFNDYKTTTANDEAQPENNWFTEPSAPKTPTAPTEQADSVPQADGEDQDIQADNLTNREGFLVNYRRSRLTNQDEEEQRRRRRMTRWDENVRL